MGIARQVPFAKYRIFPSYSSLSDQVLAVLPQCCGATDDPIRAANNTDATSHRRNKIWLKQTKHLYGLAEVLSHRQARHLILEGAGSVVESGKAHATVSISADATMEGKVDFLIRQVAALDSAIARVDDRVDEVNSSLKKTATEFQTSVSTLTTTLNNVIASHVVGSYDVSLFGINITVCGTVIQFFYS